MISDMIPDNDSNWIVKGNTIYYNYLAKIPILVLEDDNYWVILDRRYTKAFMKMMFFLLKNDFNFYFKSRFINNKELFDNNQINNFNIRAYLLLLEDKNIYKYIKTEKYPYNKILINYIKYFNCMDVFIEELIEVKKELLGSYHDYYSNTSIYTIPDEEIRNMIQSLDRIIKIEYVIG
jgi:hypothetical protein